MQGIQTRKRARHVVPLVAAGFAVVAAVAAPATASPTRQDIVRDCNSGVGKCTFTPNIVGKVYKTPLTIVPGMAANCSYELRKYTKSWTHKASTTSATGVTLGAQGADIVKSALPAKDRTAWTTSVSRQEGYPFLLRPGQAAYVVESQLMQAVHGTWKTHYDDPHWGHYFWSVNDTITHPVKEGTDGMHSTFDIRLHWMNESEQIACLRGAYRDVRGLPMG
ncbi:hypothetical protein [Streptomyces sp. NPDC048191]|uniref:hypothetical protein n=1 Tax=Streptomyces sp. NPDC048191 TaxID=3155484 RepID=UPI0033E1CD45